MSDNKVPHVIECFIKRCQNYHCINNRSGSCQYGDKLQVYNCFEYKHEHEVEEEP